MALAGMAATALAALATACGDDGPSTPSTPDYVPDYLVQVRVQNTDGRNLLDAREPDNILKDGVSALYQGRTYTLDTVVAYDGITTTEGMVLKRYVPVGTRKYLMYLGPFDGKKNVSAQDIILHWNDHSKDDTITVTHQYATSADGTPHSSTTLQLNRKDVDMTQPVTIVLGDF